MLLQPTGEELAFENYETGEFFTELLKKFSQEKDEEDWRQEYAPAKRSLGEFKNPMILGLYHMERKRKCLQFMKARARQYCRSSAGQPENNHHRSQGYFP